MDKSSQHEIPGELLSAWCDGELSPEEHARVEQLLHESPAARREVEEIRQLSRLLADLPQESAPQELVAATLRRCEQELQPLEPPATTPVPAHSNGTAAADTATSPPMRGARWWKHPAAGLAATVALCAGLTWMFLQRDSASPEMVAASRTADEEALRELAPAGSPAMNDDLALEAATAEMAITTEETGDALAAAGNHSASAAERPAARFAGGAGVARMAVRDRIPGGAATGAAAPAEADSVAEAVGGARRHTLRNVEDVAWERIQAGEVVRVLDRDDGQIAVVELTVVNVSNSLGRLQVLLSRHAIGPLPAGLIAGSSAAADNAPVGGGGNRNRPVEYVPNASLAAVPGGVAGNRAKAADAEEQFSAVFVQTSPDRLASVLRHIRREQQFSEVQFVSTISAEEIQLDPLVATDPAQPLKREPAEAKASGQRQQITVAQLDRSLQHSAGRALRRLQSVPMGIAVDGIAAGRGTPGEQAAAPGRRAEKEQQADRSPAEPVVAPRAPATAAAARSAVPADAPVQPSAAPAAPRTTVNRQKSRRANGTLPAVPPVPSGIQSGKPAASDAPPAPGPAVAAELDRRDGDSRAAVVPSFQSPASLRQRGGAAIPPARPLAAMQARGNREAAPTAEAAKDARRLKTAASALERQQAAFGADADKRDANSDKPQARPQASFGPADSLARPGVQREGKPAGEVSPVPRPVRVLFVVRGPASSGK